LAGDRLRYLVEEEIRAKHLVRKDLVPYQQHGFVGDVKESVFSRRGSFWVQKTILRRM
jgi:hypothetical protein